MVNKRGRPSGGSDARDRLLEAAHEHLDAGDLGTTSVRALAAEVGVSHTLVNYHFGGRDALVAAVVALRVAPHHIVAASRDERGELDLATLIPALVALWERPERRPALVAFARELAADGPRAAALRAYLQRAVFDALAAALGQRRARRVAVVIVGLIFSRYVLRMPSMVSLTPTEVVELMLSMLGGRGR